MKKLLASVLLTILVCLLISCSSFPLDYFDHGDGNEILTNSDIYMPGLGAETISSDRVVVMDNELYSITVTEVAVDKRGAMDFKVHVVNKSPDKEYTFKLGKTLINGLQFDLLFSIYDVKPGKEGIETIRIYSSEVDFLKSEGMELLSDFEFFFEVYDSDHYLVEMDSAHVYPYGQDKAAVFTRKGKNSDKVLIDNEYVTLLYIGNEIGDSEGEYKDTTYRFYIINKSVLDIDFRASDVYLNDIKITYTLKAKIAAGQSTYGFIECYSFSLKELEIKDVNKIELDVYATIDETFSEVFRTTVEFNP